MSYGICFVCLGNICRSPTAEGIFRHRLSSFYPEAKIYIDSAGTAGYHEGALADPRSRAAASERGYKLESRAAQFKTNDFSRFSLILAMDSENLRNLQAIAPSSFAGELRFLETLTRRQSQEHRYQTHIMAALAASKTS